MEIYQFSDIQENPSFVHIICVVAKQKSGSKRQPLTLSITEILDLGSVFLLSASQ